MAQKKQEKDILLVRDEKTGEIGVVAGLNGDGTPKLTDADAKHTQSFLHFDRHGDMLDNFFTNFYRQCTDPTRFGFYRVAAEQAEQLVGVMKDLLKNPEANRDLLAAHKVDTSAYAEHTRAEAQTETIQKYTDNMEQTTKQEAPQETAAESPKRSYQPIDESKIDWAELESKWGVRREGLEQTGDLRRMLNYGKSDLVRISPALGGERFETEARLSFKSGEDGRISLVPHFIRQEPDLTQEYKGHKFSEEDIRNLRTTGNLGRKVELLDKETGELVPSYVSLDRKTRELTDIAADKVRIRDKIAETPLTKTEQDLLRTGAPLRGKEITLADGRKFRATLQVNVEQRGVEFVPRSRRQEQTEANRQERGVREGNSRTDDGDWKLRANRLNWQTDDGKIKPIAKWKNVEFTDKQREDYRAGKAVKLENVLDRKGQPATMYLKFNPEKGRPYLHRRNPDAAQAVAPSNESRTQVAVNSQGRSNEATKRVKEPLTKGQTAPKENQEPRPRRKAGIKM